MVAACEGSPDATPVVQVCERFQKAAASAETFYTVLVRILEQHKARRIAFDVERGTIYSSDVRALVERLLPKAKGAAQGKGRHPARACSYTGAAGSLQTGPFPTVRLPILNKDSPLVSMFEEADCNRRYQLTGSSIVPVDEDVVQAMQDALAFIVSPSRKGATWRGVWNGHFDKSREQQDLLISYVAGAVNTPAKVASLFGTGSDSDVEQFHADASAVCEALDGIARKAPTSRLDLFLLRGVSEGQVQVQASSRPTVQEVIDGARTWQSGGENIPRVLLPMPGSKGTTGRYQPRTPHPDELVSITSRQWLEAGKRWSPSRGAEFGQVLTVMLRGSGWQDTAESMLGLLNRRTWPLMLGLFGAVHRSRPGEDHRHGYRPDSCLRATKAVSTAGILLDALGSRKEKYMSESSFLVGRLLALADLLHREHSRQERKSEGPPPQMIGNALMAVARDNPMAAVARLNDRLPFYTAWAERSGDGLARWAVARLRDTATNLAATTLPSSTGNSEKAQLMLGYISKLSDSNDEGDGLGNTSGGQG